VKVELPQASSQRNDVKPESIIASFADLAVVSENCPRGCNHFDEDCAMVEAVAAGKLGENAAARLDSVQRLLRSL
jgi:ribosome biogenesis GTPase